jgi:hypothetical protein
LLQPERGAMKLVTGSSPGWSALLSDDDLFRFSLDRPVDRAILEHTALEANPLPTGWSAGWVLASCGLNPSTADAFRNDPTVRKEIGFAARWGCERYLKINAYAWRDTKPENMWRAAADGRDIVGADRLGSPPCGNDQAIIAALTKVKRCGGIALAAWGTHVQPARAWQLYNLATGVGVQWMCLGTNKDGSPKHSLYPPYTTPLVPWQFGGRP